MGRFTATRRSRHTLHVGCVGFSHEMSSLFGDENAANRAGARTNLADPMDVVATLIPQATQGLRPPARFKAAVPMAAWSADEVDAVLSVNVKGPFLCTKHAAPQMKEGSVIVNCSSLLATIPMPLAAPYAASKAALLSLTRSAAAELSERGIVVCPGVVDTPMTDRVSLLVGAPKSALADMVCPSRQVASPDRIAEVVTALMACPTSYESGSALRIGPDALELISL